MLGFSAEILVLRSTEPDKNWFKNVCPVFMSLPLFSLSLCGPNAVVQTLQDRICLNFHKTWTLGQIRKHEKLFWQILKTNHHFGQKSTFYKLVYFFKLFLKTGLSPCKGRFSKLRSQVQTAILQRAFWHTFYRNLFRG